MIYGTSPIKRHRATKEAMRARRNNLLAIVAEANPMTVRQTFYQATIRANIEKSESGYARVQRDLAEMRRDGALPYGWIVDNTRWQRKPRTFSSVEQALLDTAQFYRKSLWDDADAYVEIWLEKDALAGVIYPITSEYDVPLMVSRGYASLSFLHGAAEHIATLNCPVYLYHLGDFDPSGVNAGEKIEETIRAMAPDADIHFQRLAVTAAQIVDFRLPTRPTKASDSRSRSFGAISVELDAVHPQILRDLVEAAIVQHLPADQLAMLRIAERSEREFLTTLAQNYVGNWRAKEP